MTEEETDHIADQTLLWAYNLSVPIFHLRVAYWCVCPIRGPATWGAIQYISQAKCWFRSFPDNYFYIKPRLYQHRDWFLAQNFPQGKFEYVLNIKYQKSFVDVPKSNSAYRGKSILNNAFLSISMKYHTVCFQMLLSKNTIQIKQIL